VKESVSLQTLKTTNEIRYIIGDDVEISSGFKFEMVRHGHGNLIKYLIVVVVGSDFNATANYTTPSRAPSGFHVYYPHSPE